MKLSIIIPLYNESDSILNVLGKLDNVVFPDCVESFEIIIVDDCSTDNSADTVTDYRPSGGNVKIVRHAENQGKGAAVRTGIENASGNVFLIQDADSELSPNDIPAMIMAMDRLQVDFVNGSRYLPGLVRPLYSYKRYLGNKFFTFLTSAVIDVKLTDMACGYKLLRKELYDQLNLKENRFGFEAELLIKALHIKRNNIAEVPVQYFPRNVGEGKKLAKTDAINVLLTIIRYGIGEKLKTRNFKLAKFANLLIALVIVWTVFNQRFWRDENRIICWDAISYYAYLPATFIYHDVSLKFTDTYKGPHKFKFWPEVAPNGGKVIKTSMGLSYLYAPFFMMGHLTACFFHYDTGGYSNPYRFFIIVGAVFYLMLGLYFLRKILERYFSQGIVAVTLIMLTLSTNLYYYAAVESAMVHVYDFALFSAYIYITMKWHDKQTWGLTLIIGLLSGVISLVRPVNVLVVLIFIIYGVSSWHDLIARLKLFLVNYYKILSIGLLVFLVWIPQFLYWKTVTGQWVFYSYGDEHFFFNQPQIWRALIGFRKGLFIYTPLMIIAFAGLPLLFKKCKEFSWLIPVFLVINGYIIFSWWAWWYGGCYGMRPFVDFYGLLAIPIGCVIQWIGKLGPKIRYACILGLCLIFLQGVHTTIQFYYGAIHWDAMTRPAYFDSFWRVKPSARFPSLLAHPDYELAKKGIDAVEKP